MIDLLLNNFWLSVSLWLFSAISENLLAVSVSRAYRHSERQLVFENDYELSAFLREDIRSHTALSTRFVAYILFTYVILWLIWTYAVFSGQNPALFEFVIGLVILAQPPALTRHLKYLVFFAYAEKTGRVQGRLLIPTGLSRRLFAVDLVVFALLYLLMFASSGRVFYTGGACSAVACALVQLRQATVE